MVKKEFDSLTRQETIQSELEGIRLQSFMDRNEISDQAEGMEKFFAEINNLNPQAPPSILNDVQKTRYLRRALLGVTWAKGPISRIYSFYFSFN